MEVSGGGGGERDGEDRSWSGWIASGTIIWRKDGWWEKNRAKWRWFIRTIDHHVKVGKDAEEESYMYANTDQFNIHMMICGVQ